MTATWANYLSAMKEPKPERPRFCNSSATQCRCLPETQSCLCPLSSFHRQPTQQGSGGGRRARSSQDLPSQYSHSCLPRHRTLLGAGPRRLSRLHPWETQVQMAGIFTQ
ncbi:uncharacterized protein LOC144582037 isoform X2 [Callithrix jacchus]